MQLSAGNRGWGIAFVLLAACAGVERREQASFEPFELSSVSAPAWVSYILPDEDETAWLQIPWRSTFADGLRDAATDRKPVLFWGMNGHPLGAT